MTRSRIGRVLLALVAALLVVGAATFAWVWFAPCWMGGCAPLADLAEYQAEGSQLLDVHEKPFGTLATVNRRVVSLDSLPAYVPQAFVAVEDRRFYEHHGIDMRRLFGALARNVEAGEAAEGASTITQQLARNLFPEWLPYQERTLRRKLLEARVARQIERRFSKQKILELYLNHIYLGSGAYGIEAASEEYFGKPASELTLPEAATLAALPKAPSQLDPSENPEGARERRDLVLEQMEKAGYLTAAQAEAAKATPLTLAEEGVSPDAPHGSYFVEAVRQELAEMVGSRFYTAGLTIYTTLDLDVQRAAEQELARELEAIESGRFGTFRHPTYADAKGEAPEGRTRYLQGAVVVMDAETGEVRALVGGRDYRDSRFDRATQALRQPGSAFKPFVYATALEAGHTPVDRVEDAPLRLTLSNGQVWEPTNYTGNYAGPMTLRDALTRSKNTATVRLSQEVGIDRIIETAHQLGISNEIPSVPATALGAAVVRPIELTQAYAAFANGGNRVEPHLIRKIVDRHGAVVWESGARTEPALSPAVAFVLTTILEDVVSRGTGTAVRQVGFQGPAAGKTGTTNAATDVWFVGYTPELVAGVWIGFDEPETIVPGASGGTLAAPVWGRIMKRVYADRPTPSPWTPPAGVTTATVEVGTGRLVDDLCPAQGPTYTEYFVNGPPPAVCDIGGQYATTLPGDTFWVDEEWGATEIDTTLPPLPEGVDWPELEALRRRARADTFAIPDTAGSTLPPLPDLSPRGSATAPPPGGSRTPPREPAREDEREEPPRPEPVLLGRPAHPDSVAVPPPDTAGSTEHLRP
jgi:penicillin-binding protein 1A